MGYTSDAREEHAHAQATTSPSIMKTSVHRLSFGIGGISELHAKDKETGFFKTTVRLDARREETRSRAAIARARRVFVLPPLFFPPISFCRSNRDAIAADPPPSPAARAVAFDPELA